jgi:hypothetical protein
MTSRSLVGENQNFAARCHNPKATTRMLKECKKLLFQTVLRAVVRVSRLDEKGNFNGDRIDHSEHWPFFSKTNWLRLLGEITTVYSENYTIHKQWAKCRNLLVSRQHSGDDRTTDDYEAVDGITTGRRNRSIRRKSAPVPFCPPQMPHDVTWD